MGNLLYLFFPPPARVSLPFLYFFSTFSLLKRGYRHGANIFSPLLLRLCRIHVPCNSHAREGFFALLDTYRRGLFLGWCLCYLTNALFPLK